LAKPKAPQADQDTQETVFRLLGTTIRALRKQQRLKQSDLALRTGIARNYISQVELGRRNVTVLNLVRLAVALGVPPSSLLSPLDMRPELILSAADTKS
jgi:transcriptional regulator with XRE-family HTH domain